MDMSSDRSKALLATFFLIAIGLGVYFGLKLFNSSQVAEGFSGNVSSVKGDSIIVKGYYTVNGKLYGHLRNVEVVVTPDTKFNATVLYSPTEAELAKTGGKWDMSALKKEELPGSIKDISSVSLIFIGTNSNIFNQSAFDADTISYTKVQSPDTTKFHELCEDSNGKYIGAEACIKKNNIKIK